LRKINGENLWGKLMGKSNGENQWGKLMGKIMGKIYGENYICCTSCPA
jgi:hypothetical protein